MQASFPVVVPGLPPVGDAVTSPGRPLDVRALVAHTPFERERRAEGDAALRSSVLAALSFVVGQCLLEAGEPLAVIPDLFFEERDRLIRLQEPEQEDAQERLVPCRSVGDGIPQPPLDFDEPFLGDGIGLAPSRPVLADAKEALRLERG